MSAKWSEERKEIVRELWLDGFGAATIASHVGGVTRNSVIGLVHRMGLPRLDRLPRKPLPPKPRRKPDPAEKFNPLPARKKDLPAVKTMPRIRLRTGRFDSFDPEPRLGRIVPTGRIKELAAHFMRWRNEQ